MDVSITTVETGPRTMDVTLCTYEWNIGNIYNLMSIFELNRKLIFYSFQEKFTI